MTYNLYVYIYMYYKCDHFLKLQFNVLNSTYIAFYI